MYIFKIIDKETGKEGFPIILHIGKNGKDVIASETDYGDKMSVSQFSEQFDLKINYSTNEKTKLLLKLAAKLLERASDEFSNHGCNDMDEEYFEGWTHEQFINFCKDLFTWDESIDDRDLNNITPYHIDDSSCMSYLSEQLLKLTNAMD